MEKMISYSALWRLQDPLEKPPMIEDYDDSISIEIYRNTAWWFGTCFIFHNIWDVILPIDELHHFPRWLLHHQPEYRNIIHQIIHY